MNILVDENIPRITVRALSEMNHDVRDIRGTDMEGSSDTDLWEVAQREQRLVVTTDKGFAKRRGSRHQGILIVRLRQPSRTGIHDRVMQAMARFEDRDWPGLTVVMRDNVQSVWRPTKAT